MRQLARETTWVEFKDSNEDPKAIGSYISALSNSAALNGQSAGWLVWGVKDGDHSLVGTSFNPHQTKIGNEDLENWLLRLLSPQINFSFNKIAVEDLNIVLLRIDPASTSPVRFEGVEYIRVGSYKKPLKDHQDIARRLWRTLDRTSFEDGVSLESATDDEVLDLIDYPSYFRLLGLPLPEGRYGILAALESDRLFRPIETGEWSITNLGAVLFAKDFSRFLVCLERLCASSSIAAIAELKLFESSTECVVMLQVTGEQSGS